MLLHCVRHGESTYNAEGRIQGQADVPLSELGLRQGQAVAAALRRLPIDAVYSSPLQRAYKTAEIVAEMFGLPILTDDRLKELSAGVFQDKLRSELEEMYPYELQRWTSGDPTFAIPEGESRDDLRRRGTAALRAIAANGYGSVAVVSHGRLLITALKGLLNIPLDAQPQSLQNGSITSIEIKADRQPTLLAINQVDHLAHLGFSGQGDL